MTFQTENEQNQEPKAEEQPKQADFEFNERNHLIVDMLAYKRPHKSASERKFLRRFIEPLGAKMDGHGNFMLRIGDAPVLWSCHTDTVHSKGGKQKMWYTEKGVLTVNADTGSCLGADDGAGVYLMYHMAKAGVPGLYIFHRGEEKGCIGSKLIAKKNPDLLKGIKFAIAFDRMGYKDVITHQRGDRCCSDEFAKSLADLLGDGYSPCRGVYTDTANYTDLIGECTNISVGYFNQHSQREELDVPFLDKLLDKLLTLDISKLVESRKPGEKDSSYSYSSYSNDWYCGGDYGYPYGHNSYYSQRQREIRPIERDNPEWLPERKIIRWKTYDSAAGRMFWEGEPWGYVDKTERDILSFRRAQRARDKAQADKDAEAIATMPGRQLVKSSNGNLYSANTANSNMRAWEKRSRGKSGRSTTIILSGDDEGMFSRVVDFVTGKTKRNPLRKGNDLVDDKAFGARQKNMADWCRDYPEQVADFLEHFGFVADDLKEYIEAAFKGLLI